MTKREKLDELWDSVYYTDDFPDRLKDIVPILLELLITSLLEQEEIEIGLLSSGKGSIVAYDIYNADKILELRYLQTSSFELHVALEDDEEGSLKSFYHTLGMDEIAIIPEGLQILLKRAFHNDEEMVWNPGTVE